MGRFRPSVNLYVAAVTVAGVIATAIVVGVSDWSPVTGDPALFAFLLVLVVAGELFPVEVTFRNERQEVNTSTTFVLAILLMFGPGPAIVAQVSASAIADIRTRKSAQKIGFNVGQYALATVAASVVLHVALGRYYFASASSFTTSHLVVIVFAAAAFFITNIALLAIVLGLAQGAPVWPHFRRTFAFYGLGALILFSLVPVVVIIAGERPILIPLLLAPILAVYRTAKIATEKEHQAQYDSLTDLPNRVLLYERLEQAIVERPGTPFAVYLIDLDHFKEVNDTLGHQVGDQLLTTIGERLALRVDGSDTVARLGGDEFAVVLTIRGEDEEQRIESARAGALGVAAAFDDVFRVDELTFQIEASIGTAVYPEHGREVDELLRRADVAMYQAKDLGTGIEIYQMARDSHDSRRLALLGELRQAIDAGEIVCHYQPKADLETGQVVGAEALVRWDHPEHGHLTPDQFIPLAEPTGLISPLTLHVLDTALSHQRSWARQGMPITVSVNVSVRTLYDDAFPAEVRKLIERHGVSPSMVVLEVTESTMMSDPSRAAAVLNRLAELGVQISVDDFGTGYSSLAYLKRLPITEMKIDKSFVIGMEQDIEQLTIVSSIVDLGRNLGLRVVAEGVETPTAWDLLRERGCHRAQGYLLSRPLPAPAFLDWLRDYQQQRRAAAGDTRVPAEGKGNVVDIGHARDRTDETLRARLALDELA
jgi:diguanylate cyclase (GGDEF)-like protein